MSIEVSTAEIRVSQNEPNLNTSNFTYRFPQPLDLGSLNYRISLAEFRGWFTTVNLVGKVLAWEHGMTSRSMVIPDGLYTVADVNALYEKDQIAAGVTDWDPETGARRYPIRILPNFNTNRVDVVIDNSIGPGSYSVLLNTPESLASFFGFNPVIVTGNGIHPGDHIANVTTGVNTWHLRCDLVRNSFSGGRRSDILFAFAPETVPNGRILKEPIHLRWLQVNRSSIDSINFRMTDDNNNELDFAGEEISFTVLIEPIPATYNIG